MIQINKEKRDSRKAYKEHEKLKLVMCIVGITADNCYNYLSNIFVPF